MKNVLIGIMNYNFEKYLHSSIKSAFEQSYPCDIFVTDDGSTDSSREVVMELGYRGINCLFHEDNSGDELRAVKDIIWFSEPYDYAYLLSGDDELYPDSIENLLACAERENGDWVYGGLDVINTDGNLVAQWTYDGFPESTEQAIAYMWTRQSLGTTLGSLFSTRFLKGKHLSRFPGTSFSLDACTAIDWYTHNPNIRRARKQVLKYRDNPLGRSSLLKKDRGIMQLALRAKMLNVFGEEYIMKCVEGK